MNLTTGQRLICERVINVFETGTVKGRYDAISIYHDGPDRIRQITYGRSQTTEYGNLKRLVEMYSKANGLLSLDLSPFVKMIGATPLVDNDRFKTLLRRAGAEDPVMRATQDLFFDLAYFNPALKWATSGGFSLPLSMLVIYDSFIHSGSIRKDLRARFAEPLPVNGGDEKRWIADYVRARHEWLTNHSNPDVRPSAYRTRDLLREIDRGNWTLAMLPINANGTNVDDTGASPAPALPDLPVDNDQAPVTATEKYDATDRALLAATSTPDMPRADTDRLATLVRLGQEAGISAAVSRLIAYRNAHRPSSDPRYWAAVNFDLHSSKPRMFLFDCVAGVTTSHLCAHGRGSEGAKDDGYAEIFSNEDGSNCSSLGIYHCDVTYQGGHGLSLYLDGLEPSNSNARHRHIVIHGADYVSRAFIAQTGRIGRSEGCPAVGMSEVATVIPALKGGSLMILWKSS